MQHGVLILHIWMDQFKWVGNIFFEAHRISSKRTVSLLVACFACSAFTCM